MDHSLSQRQLLPLGGDTVSNNGDTLRKPASGPSWLARLFPARSVLWARHGHYRLGFGRRNGFWQWWAFRAIFSGSAINLGVLGYRGGGRPLEQALAKGETVAFRCLQSLPRSCTGRVFQRITAAQPGQRQDAHRSETEPNGRPPGGRQVGQATDVTRSEQRWTGSGKSSCTSVALRALQLPDESP